MKKNEGFNENDADFAHEYAKKTALLSNFAQLETSDWQKHKLLKRKDFSLPENVVKELQELEKADLTDLLEGYGERKKR